MRKIIFSLLVISILSCQKDSSIDGSMIISNPAMAAELKNNSETIAIGNKTYLLEAYIYRNLRPGS